MSVPNTFNLATGSIPLSQLDANFAYYDAAFSISGTIATFTSPIVGSVTGNAATVTDGIYSTGSYANPSWITSLDGSKVSSIPNSSLTNSSITINGSAISLGGSVTVAPSTIGTFILYGNGSGGFSNVTIGSGLNFSAGTLSNTGGAGMVYPSAGIPVSTGSAWGTSKTTPTGNIVGTTDTQTLTNKTLTGFTETVFAATTTTPALSPTNGTIQTWTLSGSSTPTAGTWGAGQSLTLMITAGANTITWTSVPVTWVGGSAPTLATSGVTIIELWKVGTTVYGAYVGAA